MWQVIYLCSCIRTQVDQFLKLAVFVCLEFGEGHELLNDGRGDVCMIMESPSHFISGSCVGWC